MIQAGPNEPWRPATDAVAECVDFQPTRARVGIALLIAVPVVWLGLHATLFGTWGIGGPAAVVLVGIVAAAMVVGTSRRTRTVGELFKGGFGITVGVLFFLGELAGLVPGVGGWLKEHAIRTALAANDPCAVESLEEDNVKAYASDAEQQQYYQRYGDCRTARENAACARALAALDRKSNADGDYALVGDPQQAEKTHGVFMRLAQGKLNAADLGWAKLNLECGDGLWSRLVAGLAASPTAWSMASPEAPLPADNQEFKLSEDMQTALAAQGVSEPAKTVLRARAEKLAKSDLAKNTILEMAGGKGLCEQAASLKVDVGPSCKALAKRYAGLEANERAASERAAARQGAQDDAAEQREKTLFVSCMTACNRGRTEQQAQEDNARAADCNEKCGSDPTCLASCSGGGSASGCQLGCARKYPGAASGL
jgi:hypothetical protein